MSALGGCDLSPELDPSMLREKLSYHAACCVNTAGGM